MVRSEQYQKVLKHPGRPELVNAFLCASMILENAEKYAEAGYAHICAAWVFDDVESKEDAVRCRKMAIKLLELAREKKQKFFGSEIEDKLLLIDLMRRVGFFGRAIDICDSVLEDLERFKTFIDVATFQKGLIEKQDTTCHQISEAVERIS